VLHYAIISQIWKQTYYGPAFMTQFWDLRKELVNYINIWHIDPIVSIPYLSNVLLDSEKDLFVLNCEKTWKVG